MDSQLLLSLPPAIAQTIATLTDTDRQSLPLPEAIRSGDAFVGHDPETGHLGSGGGTVHLLHSAWEKAAKDPIESWISDRQRVVLHAGGQSRRLPAYAALGKSLIPIPLHRGITGARLGQTLCDVQLPLYQRVLAEAGPQARLLLASGDVWLDFDPGDIAPLDVDFCGIGMRVSAELATDFGVFFLNRERGAQGQRRLDFIRQKPDVATIYEDAQQRDFLVDTGLWLLSEKAVNYLLTLCGWDVGKQRFVDGQPRYLDFYADLAPQLGQAEEDPRFPGLGQFTAGVAALEQAKFYHLGSSRQMFESMEAIETRSGQQPQRLYLAAAQAPELSSKRDTPVWVDAGIASPLQDARGFNLLTNISQGALPERLERGQCLHLAPLKGGQVAVCPYGLDDAFKGSPAQATFCAEATLASWAEKRGLNLDADLDAYRQPLFPVVDAESVTESWIQFFFADAPSPETSATYRALPRVSWFDLLGQTDTAALLRQRGLAQDATSRQLIEAVNKGEIADEDFLQDFAFLASEADRLGLSRPAQPEDITAAAQSENQARWLLLQSKRATDEAAKNRLRHQAFATLQEAVIRSSALGDMTPRRALKDDQIVWARSPARIDLAGGWTDTPPYCFVDGGSVLNLAVNLNGQPPVQVFVRPIAEPELRLHSIDLGTRQVIRADADLESYEDPTTDFSLPKAALALAGFARRFSSSQATTLAQRLHDFGGGLELSLLCAIPKGSGLGTSSILAATLLGALSRACGLDWDKVTIYRRVLALEQLLTTGGGWQDQAGALFGGVKLIETEPGPSQNPTVRYLPTDAFDPPHANRTQLLYYTGLTRLARGILQEIVSGMFLGRSDIEHTLAWIRGNARRLHDAIQQGRADGVAEAIRRSWELNCALDSGTSTPEIEAIIERIRPDLAAWKLPGAGGGGYLFLIAKDEAAGDRIRATLTNEPTNPRARLVDFAINRTGLEVTVS